jgi:pyruvate dehydrogenase E2 component (dihydrolipoamide acetyltransferase)
VPKNVIMPALGVAQETGRVLKWLRAEGEQVHENEMLLEIETDKATVELEAPVSGVLLNVTAAPGDEVPVGTVIAKIWSEEEIDQKAATLTDGNRASMPSRRVGPRPVEEATNNEGTTGGTVPDTSCPESASLAAHAQPRQFDKSDHNHKRVLSSPKARRLASERGIDLNTVLASGIDRPVTAANVLQAETPSPAPPQQTAVSRIWRIMADRTAEAWRSIPHFYLVREVDASSLMDWHESLCRAYGRKVTYTDLLLKKVATCLRSHPRLISEWRSGTLQPHLEVNIGLAVAIDEGLVVPVIRDTDKLTAWEIARERKRLVERARSGKLEPDDLSAGTFTISNLGMYGVDFFQAIVNPPQAAILAVGRIAQRVVSVESQPAVRPMMTLGLSCDHRQVDGAHAARFLGELADSLECASPAEA